MGYTVIPKTAVVSSTGGLEINANGELQIKDFGIATDKLEASYGFQPDSNNKLYENNATVSRSSFGYVTVKSVTAPNLNSFSGKTYRIGFNLKSYSTGSTVWGRILINGNVVYTGISASTNYVLFTTDQIINSGDVIELQLQSGNYSTVYNSEFWVGGNIIVDWMKGMPDW